MKHTKHALSLLSLVLALLMLLSVGTSSLPLSASEPVGMRFLLGEEQVRFVDTASAGNLNLPTLTGTEAAYFVGWYAQKGEESVFLPAGAHYFYEAGESTEFSAVLVHAVTARNATMRFDDTAGNGIRFTTELPLADWQRLVEIGAEPARGTLIVPHAYIKQIGGVLTHAALDAHEKKRLDVPVDAWYESDGEAATFAGGVSGIHFHHYTLLYSARGYISFTYSNGQTAYHYAAYERGVAMQESAWEVIYAARQDLSDMQNEEYPYAVGDRFSRYTDAERAAMERMFAPAVSLLVDEGYAGNRKLNPAFNEAYEAYYIRETDPMFDADLRNAVGIDANGAMVVVAKDGTPLTAENVPGVVLTVDANYPGIAVNFVFHKGKVIIPYSDYSQSY